MEPARPAAPEPDRAPRIVLIEDDADIAELIASILESEGMVVDVADTATQGLSLATARPPSLIITDLYMPGLNGADILLAVRRELQLKGTPVLVITADDRAEMRAACLALGAKAYLPKPFDADQLLYHVRAQLS